MSFEPGYRKLLQDGTLEQRVLQSRALYACCRLCPRECAVDRRKTSGFCGAGAKAVVASFGPHFGEEKVLVGRNGSGTIFFACCNLGCVFCQNYELSVEGRGYPVSNERLAEIMLLIQNDYKCANINLVTPTHFVPSILEAVYLAAQKGLCLPLVYNCGGYESLASLGLLEGVIDIYMPDFKSASPKRSKLYSQARDYPAAAKAALLAMDRQVQGLKTDEKGLAVKGLLIRHLVMPEGVEDSKEVLRFIKRNLSADVLVNVMGQYYPCHQAARYPEINRRIKREEYREVREFGEELGLRLA